MIGDDLSPKISVFISDIELHEELLKYVKSVSVELTLDKIAQITMNIANPFEINLGSEVTSKLIFEDSMMFMPGNVVTVYMGWGRYADTLVGAGLIRRYLPDYPESGEMPSIEIKALDAGCLLLDGDGNVNAQDVRSWQEDIPVSTMISEILGEYGISSEYVTQIDTSPSVPVIKKKGMSDYAFIRGLANLFGHELYFNYNGFQFADYKTNKRISGSGWECHWTPTIEHGPEMTFTWGPSFKSAKTGYELLSFSPEFAVQGVSTDVQLYYYDRDTLTWEQIQWPTKENRTEKKRFEWNGDDHSAQDELSMASTPITGRGLRIHASGYSVEVMPHVNFESKQDAVRWAESWWRRRQGMLIKGSGRVIGIPSLRPGQVHNLQGISPGLSGRWYFVEVTHNYDQDSGYYCDFVARKILP